VQGSFYEGNAATQFANLALNGSGVISCAGNRIPLPWFGPRFVLENGASNESMIERVSPELSTATKTG
jgi:hypothetical protein